MAGKLSAKELLELAIKIVDMPEFKTNEELLQYARTHFGNLKFRQLDAANGLAIIAEKFSQAAND